MEVFVGLLALLAGVVLVLAGAHGRAPQLLATITGAGASSAAAGTSGGHPAGQAANVAPGPVAATAGVRYA